MANVFAHIKKDKKKNDKKYNFFERISKFV
jgi:hypothetical protein